MENKITFYNDIKTLSQMLEKRDNNFYSFDDMSIIDEVLEFCSISKKW